MNERATSCSVKTPFDYGTWSRLLALVVTAEGKVDYEVLAAHRDLLEAFVALLGSASPDTAPERFPTEDHALAYWINAYNAFVLDAVMAEYPIRSVWKVKDGQFFDRRRHDAGSRGEPISGPRPTAPSGIWPMKIDWM
jgi:hypothetical protein